MATSVLIQEYRSDDGLSSISIFREWKVNGVFTDPDSVVLKDADGLYGIKNADTGDIVIDPNTPYTHVSTGYYNYLLENLPANTSYLVATQVSYGGQTFQFLNSYTTSAATTESVPTNGLCTRADIENIFGIPNVKKWALLSGSDPNTVGGATEIVGRINWAIMSASADFRNAMRQGGYVLTGTNNGLVPGTSNDCIIWQTNVVAVMAGLLLYTHLRPTQRGDDGRPTPDKYDGIFTWAEQQINFVRARKLRLDAQTFGTGANGPFVVNDSSSSRSSFGFGYGPPSLSDTY